MRRGRSITLVGLAIVFAAACDSSFSTAPSGDAGPGGSTQNGDAAATSDGGGAQGADATTTDDAGATVDGSMTVGSDAAALPGVCGDTCHVIFVTSQTWNGDLGGIAGATQKCHQIAAESKVKEVVMRAGRFVPWISSGNDNAVTRVPTSGSFARTDGPVIAMSTAQLLSGTLLVTIDHDENAALIATGNLAGASWTDTAATGTTVSTDDCLAWMSSNQTEDGVIGRATSMDSTWTNYAPVTCDSLKHLYCIDAF